MSSLSIVPPREVLERGRPDPPRDLTAGQAVEWRAIVRRMPADWFPRETHGLLADYCRHVLRSRKIATLIDRIERALTTIGVMLFSVGVWTSRRHHHLLRLHCELPGTRSDGPRLKRANEADTTECD